MKKNIFLEGIVSMIFRKILPSFSIVVFQLVSICASAQTSPDFFFVPGGWPRLGFTSVRAAAEYGQNYSLQELQSRNNYIDPRNPQAVAAGASVVFAGPLIVNDQAASQYHYAGLPVYTFQRSIKQFTICNLDTYFTTCEDYFNYWGYYQIGGIAGGVYPWCRFLSANGSTVSAYPPFESACPGTTTDVLRNAREPSKNCESGAPPDQFGNPIRPLNGTKIESVATSLQIGGKPLVFYYDSALLVANNSNPGYSDLYTNYLPSLGAAWRSGLHKKMSINSSASVFSLDRGNGTALNFWASPAGLVSDGDVNDKLVAVAGGYIFTDALHKTEEYYNNNGQLLNSMDSAGNSLTYSYSNAASSIAPAAGYLMSVTDSNGRSISFEYGLATNLDPSRNGHITKIIDSSGRIIVPSYDSNENLIALTWSDGNTLSLLYENSLFSWALTGIVDENGQRFATFAYDANGLVISSEHAGGVDNFSVSYQTPPAAVVREVVDESAQSITRFHEWTAATAAAVTNPQGNTISLGSANVLGRSKMSNLSQPAGSGCQASNTTASYDANGNVLSSNDFNGARTCYAYDASNREILKVEGLDSNADCSVMTSTNVVLPSNARATLTQWHPDWQLPTQITSPGNIISKIYNGQPDPFNSNALASCTSAANMLDGKPMPLVCKTVVQATLANGALDNSVLASTTNFTYDNAGRLLTVTDSNHHTTGNTYYADTSFTGTDPGAVGHTLGDLQSTTNASGFTTTFDAYDKQGHLLQTTDPKGIVTTIAYSPRGWVTTVTINPPSGNGRTTTYTYDAIGQITGTLRPDGTSISFGYDAAHRLVSATDAKGNKVAYTLDNVGNRIVEQINDPSGVLQRSITRSFDALNRLQYVNGATQ